MTLLTVSGAWRARLAAAVNAPPLRPREILWWRAQRIGSVEPDLFPRAGLVDLVRQDAQGWHVQGELTASLAGIAAGLRDAGLAHVWRDELLGVRDAGGALIGEIERAAVRPLGIATEAVHLLALDEHGRHWFQQRAFDKDTDPGRWDTLVGGMVPACDDVRQALARETWEEAGLRLAQLHDVRHGGRIRAARPSESVPHGYLVQDIEWFTCCVPAGAEPHNQDGEVAQFRTMEADEVVRRLQDDEFTLDAAMLLMAGFGREAAG